MILLFFLRRLFLLGKTKKILGVWSVVLRLLGIEVLKELHVSGHAHSEEHRVLIDLLKPEFIIPTHGEVDMLEAQKEFCKSLGYDDDKVLLLKNFDRIKF
jgi:mRNA degradation ribonuclease J1/J2